ncbi:MAG: cell division protein SepF [Oscillospiraceae bacterium]
MGVFNKLKNVFGVDDDDYDDDDDEIEEEEEQAPIENAFKADFSQVKKERNVSLSSLPQLQVVLVRPEKFDDASGIADSLNAKKTVVLNLEATSKETSRRLVDFLSGVAYANNGQLKKIANSTFIITPNNVDISGIGILDEIESNSLY